MKKFTPALVILAMSASPLVLAEVSTKSGEAAGNIPMPVNADAKVNAEINYFPHGANEEGKDDAGPFPVSGPWTFTWDSEKPDAVDFTGVFTLGDYFTVTDAGALGGVTRQTFYDFAHHVKGTAVWDAATRTLTYNLQPNERDDSQASTVTQSKEPDCDKIKGFTAGKACSAFEETSPPLEGLVLTFTFSEDLSSFDGTFMQIQYGGSGMTESQTDINGTIGGPLTDG
jgi:hypothetical protein